MKRYTVLFWLSGSGPYDVGQADIIQRVRARDGYQAIDKAAERRSVYARMAYAIPDDAFTGAACTWVVAPARGWEVQ